MFDAVFLLLPTHARCCFAVAARCADFIASLTFFAACIFCFTSAFFFCRDSARLLIVSYVSEYN